MIISRKLKKNILVLITNTLNTNIIFFIKSFKKKKNGIISLSDGLNDHLLLLYYKKMKNNETHIINLIFNATTVFDELYDK